MHFKKTVVISLIAATTLSIQAYAKNMFVRLAWDTDPAHSAVIGFTPDGHSSNAYVLYGSNSDESSWQRVDAGKVFNHDGFKSQFARLEDLKKDSPVYFKVCDESGCGDEHYWFKTAPAESKPFVFVAGGDTRSGWTTRRKGNALIAKIRPLFVMHGGDYTSRNSGRDWIQYFKDWKLTYSADSIDGKSYNRIYPIIPAHGNHEDGDYSTLCNIYGVDFNQDGQCNEYDTFGAMNVTPLLRVYVLNSQFKYSGWSRQAGKMNRWLTSDLANEGSKAQWRIAEYHKPMFPHYSGKHDNEILHEWWAQTFYDNGMNLVIESDTHVLKTTDILKPTRDSFSVSRKGGTMYVGEGTWGAPTRDADNAKQWTLDTESIQQFKVVRVYQDKMEVRTAQFGGSPEALTLEERNQNNAALPDGIDWWSIAGFGEAMVLHQNASGQSTLGKADTTEEPTEQKPETKPEEKKEPTPIKKPPQKKHAKPNIEPVKKHESKPEQPQDTPKVKPEEPVVSPKPAPEHKKPIVEPKPHREHTQPEHKPKQKPVQPVVNVPQKEIEQTPEHKKPEVMHQEREKPMIETELKIEESPVEFDIMPIFDVPDINSWFDLDFKKWFNDLESNFGSWF
jgi:hypothetical protein